MAAQIIHGETIITPRLVLSYESSQESRNIEHTILGRSDPDITQRPAGTRTGTLELFFLDEADAEAARVAHTEVGTFSLVWPERPSTEMTYVLGQGELVRTLDPETRARWIVQVPYREVIV